MKSLFGILIGAWLFCGLALAENHQKLTPVDRALPSFSLSGVDGQIYDPDALKGKTWLINFWAVWCAPCLEELPSLNDAWSKLKGKNVGMLAINIGEDAESIQSFLIENNIQIDFPIVIGDRLKTLGNWSVVTLPHTVIVNPVGRVVYDAKGDREWNDQRFIDAIAALNDVPSAASFSDKVAQTAVKFKQLRPVVRALSVIAVLFALIYMFMLVRMRMRRRH